MKKKLFKSQLLLIFLGLGIAFFLARESRTAVQDPGQRGTFTKCTYTSNLTNSGYSAAMVYYPCEKNSGPFPGTTLTGGFTNTYSQMSWIADHVVTHGFVIIAMTPNNNMGSTSQWTTAHKAGINKLISENARSASPIYGIVDTANLQIMGYSMGGGGALLASASLGTQVKSTIAMAPFMSSSYNLSGVRGSTMCFTGTSDTVASPSTVTTMYNSLPDSIQRTLGYFQGVSHLDWVNGGSHQDWFKVYITSWMKFYLDNDAGYETYLYGAEHENHMDADWFYGYAHNADFSGGGGGGCSF